MSCLRPFKIKRENKFTGEVEEIQVPCGHCEGCLKLKQSFWISRLMVEDMFSKSSYFVTLTYDNEHLPVPIGVNKPDVQKFLKRFRKLKPCRYFLVSEYGSQFSRPHYHLAMFFKEHLGIIELSKLLEKTWTLGKHCIGTIDIASISYVAKYCLKPKRDPSSFYWSKTFSLMSRRPAIGYAFLGEDDDLTHLSEIMERGIFELQVNGNVFAMPRYFRDKIFSDEQKDEHFREMQYKYKDMPQCELSENDLYDKQVQFEKKKSRL